MSGRGTMAVGLLGLLLGVGLGLLAGWVVWPAEFDIVTPELLATHYQTDYANMIAAHYARAADLDLARRQLARLGPASTAILRRAADSDPGTADFIMQPGAIYALELNGQLVAEALQLSACSDGLLGGWEIELQAEK